MTLKTILRGLTGFRLSFGPKIAIFWFFAPLGPLRPRRGLREARGPKGQDQGHQGARRAHTDRAQDLPACPSKTHSTSAQQKIWFINERGLSQTPIYILVFFTFL